MIVVVELALQQRRWHFISKHMLKQQHIRNHWLMREMANLLQTSCDQRHEESSKARVAASALLLFQALFSSMHMSPTSCNLVMLTGCNQWAV